MNRLKSDFSFKFSVIAAKKWQQRRKKTKPKVKRWGEKGTPQIIKEIDIYENEELDQWADQAKSHEEAIPVIKDYEKIIRSKRKSILNVAFRKRKVFKRLKNSTKIWRYVKVT